MYFRKGLEMDGLGGHGAPDDIFRRLFESLPVGVAYLDRECRVVIANPSFTSITGLDAEEISRTEDPPFADREARSRILDILNSGNSSSFEHICTRPDGERVHLRTYVHPLSSGPIRAQIVSMDITEGKEKEEMLRSSQRTLEKLVADRTSELKSKNEELEWLLYTISHDLRAPLLTISGFLGFLREDMRAGNSRRVEEDLRVIETAVNNINEMLEDTLKISRIGRILASRERVPFADIVNEALTLTREKLVSRGVDVVIDGDLPVVHANRLRAVEVLVNLIDNSVKYMGDQRSPQIHIGCKKNGETVFYVRDNGMGIDPKHQSNVFRLFYKIDSRSEGTGAGLALVKKIIETHGGRVWIESEPGKGCTVLFTLPVASKEENTDQK
ncbi:MAG TPA: ATP-binding protein [Methanothrix sp.]|nr:ATP-binding protein [Methanothrix sp.]HOK57947.1 ATP-binding protein [Methanothrix sp.]HOL43350.1 ATP-binding protein [Methanothrix sp.]HPO88353.1 ATP-binding protein [Methanothrix sp.]